jgi:hypothetical protein
MVLLDDILWVNEGPIDALHYYTDYFGVMPSIFSPVSGGMAVWTKDDLQNVKINGMNNVFDKIVLEDVNIYNSCPVPHYEYLTTYYPFNVPENYMMDVLALSNSISYDPVLELMSLRGSSLDDNIYTLGLATDIVYGMDDVYSMWISGKVKKKNKDNVKKAYKNLIKRKRKGKMKNKMACGNNPKKKGSKKKGSKKRKASKKKRSKKK